MSHPWSIYDLVIRTPRVELRLPTDEDLLALMRIARDRIHPPGQCPFMVRWSEAPSPEFERSFLHHHWSTRAGVTPERWTLGLGVYVDGAIVGNQGISGHQFPARRCVETGSWISMDHQGQGLGTEMRAAVLHLAFEGLGALRAESGYFDGNVRSAAVSARLGYVDNGDEWIVRDDGRFLTRDIKLERDTWLQHRRDDIELIGIDAVREQLGLATTSA